MKTTTPTTERVSVASTGLVRALKVVAATPILFLLDCFIAWSGVKPWKELRAETKYRLSLGFVTSRRPNAALSRPEHS